jgi:hypothetical protein
MAYAHADTQQVSVETITAVDEQGNTFSVEGFVIPVVVPLSEVGELLTNYDPASSTSPVVAYTRPLARVILDALKQAAEQP